MSSPHPAPTSASPLGIPAKSSAWHLPPSAAFPLLALVLFTFFAAASAPSPLFVVFQQQWGFSPALLTVAFAIYAIALLVSLLVAGSLSDHVGRRPVIFAALLLQASAMLIFFTAEGIGGLIAARVVQGIATGIASGALTAAVVEATPLSQKRLGAMISSVSPLAGLAVGALLTGLAVQVAAHPVGLVFGVLSAICVLGALSTLFIPESATPRPGALASLVPRMSVPLRARSEFVSGLPVVLAVWALGGLFLSLVPSVMQQIFGLRSGLLNGLAIATLFGVGAISPALMRRLSPARMVALCMALIAAGTALLCLSLGTGSLLLFFVGAVVAGLGSGGSFSAQVQGLAPLAESHERAELFAVLYAASYLAFSVPAMAAGQLIGRLGLLATVQGYTALLVLVAAAGSLLQWRKLRRVV